MIESPLPARLSGCPMSPASRREFLAAAALAPVIHGAWAADPQLRRLFGVEEIPDAEPPAAAPPRRSWLDLFIGRAYAAEPGGEKALDPLRRSGGGQGRGGRRRLADAQEDEAALKRRRLAALAKALRRHDLTRRRFHG